MGDKALAVLEDMKNSGNDIDARIYNALVVGYSFNGMFDEARDVIKQMNDANAAPNIFTHSALVRGYVRKEMYNEALDVINNMKEEGIDRTRQIYATIVN